MPHDDTRHPRKGVADGVVGLAGSPVRWRPVSYQMEGIWAARWVSLASKGAPEAVSSPDTTQLLEPMPAAGPADRPPKGLMLPPPRRLVPSRRSATRRANLGSARESASGSAARRSAVIPAPATAAAIPAAEVTSAEATAAATPPASSSPQAGTMAGMSSAYGG